MQQMKSYVNRKIIRNRAKNAQEWVALGWFVSLKVKDRMPAFASDRLS